MVAHGQALAAVLGMNAALGCAIAPARPEGRRANQRLSRRAAAGAERALQRANARVGFTLLETLVVLALLAISLAVAIPAFVAGQPSDDDPPLAALRAARTAAIRTGRVTVWEGDDGHRLLFLPDGSSSGGAVIVEGRRLVVEPLTGAIRASD